MAKLSIIIPSRDEQFLTPTIDDIFKNATGEIEVVAVLDSDKWPGDWKEVTARHPRLHTIHNGSPKGMRHSINAGVASALSRGATYIAKFDGHCSFGEGFDEILEAECEPDWVVVPRRLRLDPESWTVAEPDKPPHDYHYLSFPADPKDFGGPGLNGKPWVERTKARADLLLDEEMSSQGSGWFMYADYFHRLELMDESSYGPFWNEFQEIGLKCWLSGGKVMVNKRTYYAHLHKGKKYGRGYRLDEKWLTMGRNHTMLWPWNEAWNKQTKPFEWLIDHFWPVPSWPENWRGVLYANRKPRTVLVGSGDNTGGDDATVIPLNSAAPVSLKIHQAHYGVGSLEDIDVTARLQSLVRDGSLDIVVNNSTLTPSANPFRGQRKKLAVLYSIDGGETTARTVEEKDWLIIGPVVKAEAERFISGLRDKVKLMRDESPVFKPLRPEQMIRVDGERLAALPDGVIAGEVISGRVDVLSKTPTTPAALNDYLIRRFSISPQRLRGPMPIELRDFHRNDLAQLFAELGFKRGAEIGVAEGNYSEVLLKANPECELLLVDPWHAYSDNPQNKSPDKHAFAFNETTRKTKDYKGAKMVASYSMDAVRDVEEESLDFVYIDGHHSYPYVMCDVIEWTKRVRSGGIVALDDIYKLDEARWGAGPMEAIYDYARAMRINPWWLFAGHKSVDAFFVKP